MQTLNAPKVQSSRPRFIDGCRVLAANKVGGKGKRTGEVMLLQSSSGYIVGFVGKADVSPQLPRQYSDFVAAGYAFQQRSRRGF